MSINFFLEIPDVASISKLSDIRATGDLSSTILHRESFNSFEEDVLRSNTHHLDKDRAPSHWAEEHLLTEDSMDYICEVFRDKLPVLDDLKGVVSFFSNSIAIVGGGNCLTRNPNAEDIDSHKVILRMNHPYIEEFSHLIGTKTTIHFINERRCYELVSGKPTSGFSPQGLLNIFSGTTNETAALLEYARHLDSGKDPSDYFVLKPSFRKTIDIFHGSGKNPSIGFIATAFALRVYPEIHMYGFDLGEGDGKNYHGHGKLHSAHSPISEASTFLDCEISRNSFHIYR